MHKVASSVYELPHNQDRLFAERIDSITSRELSPDNLVTYADDALTDLVGVVSDMVSAYANSPTIETPDTVQRERAAFSYFGLNTDTVESTLDRIVDVSDSIKRLDGLVARKTKQVHGVIVPPDSRQMPEIQHEDGSLELPKRQIPKLNTLILLLEQHFGVDVDDNNQLSITSGIVPTEMMRAASYYLVEAPALNRAVLVCDEVGNTTFVIDTEICHELGMTASEIGALTKDDIKDLITADDRLGKQINYHANKYVRDLADVLSSPLTANAPAEHSDIQLLRPKVEAAPEGYLSVHGIAKQYGPTDATIQKAITKLADQLGEVKEYRFGRGRVVPGYSPAQIETILEHIGTAELAPEGYLSIRAIAELLGFAGPTIKKAIIALTPILGEVKVYRFAYGNTTPGYSPEQVEMIRSNITDDIEQAPEGYLSINGIKEQFGFAAPTINKAIATLANALGEVKVYRFAYGNTTPGYSPEQVEMIRNSSMSDLKPAPKGYLSSGGISRRFGFGAPTIKKAVIALTDILGEVKQYRFGNYLASGYSPEQIKKIKEWIRTNTKSKLGSTSLVAVDVGMS